MLWGRWALSAVGKRPNTFSGMCRKEGRPPLSHVKQKTRGSNWNRKPVNATQIEKAVNRKHFIQSISMYHASKFCLATDIG